MKEIIWLIKNSLNVILKSKKALLLYICTPLIAVILSASMNTQGQSLNVGLVVNDNNYITADTVKFLTGLENVNVKKITTKQAKKKIASGTLDCVITFEDGFGKSIQNGNPNHIKIASIKGTEVTSFIKSYLYHYVDNIMAIGKASKGNPHSFVKMYNNYQHSDFVLKTYTVKDTSKNKDITHQTVGYLLMIMLFSAGNLSEIILKEKESRTYFRLLSTPITAKQFVLSNITVNMLIMIVQMVLALVFMTQVFHIQTNIPIWEIGIVLLIFAFIANGLSFITVAFTNTTQASSAMQNLLFTPTCLLAGCFWPIELMPTSLQKIAEFLPQRWVLDTLTKLQDGTHFGSLYLNILILCAFAVAFFLIASYQFGRNNSTSHSI